MDLSECRVSPPAKKRDISFVEVPETKESERTGVKRKLSREKLEKWLNKTMRIKMTDGRTLVGVFLCTDCDCNIIIGSCEEYLRPPDSQPKEDPRILGLAMVPGKHVVSIEVDKPDTSTASPVDVTGQDLLIGGGDGPLDMI